MCKFPKKLGGPAPTPTLLRVRVVLLHTEGSGKDFECSVGTLLEFTCTIFRILQKNPMSRMLKFVPFLSKISFGNKMTNNYQNCHAIVLYETLRKIYMYVKSIKGFSC